MKKYVVAALFFIVSVTPARTQTRLLTMEDVVVKARTTLAPHDLTGLQWVAGAALWSYTDSSGTRVVTEGLDKPPTTAFTLPQLNAALRGTGTDTLEAIPAFDWQDSHTIVFDTPKRRMRFHVQTALAEVLTEKNLKEGADHVDLHEKTNRIAYTVGNDLYIQDGDRRIRVTADGQPGIVNGQVVHRQEFGITKGTFWSPSGDRLAFYRKDERMVTDYPVPDYAVRPAAANVIKYPMAGDSSHQVTVGIYELTTGKTTFLKTGLPADQYLTNIAWHPDEQKIYVAVLNRGQDHLKMNEYDVASGAFQRTLFEERNDKYVQPLHPMEFVPGSQDRFVWQSRRDGWNHLYLYGADGTLIRQLTKGPWEVTAFMGFDPAGRNGYYVSTTAGPLNRDGYSVSLAGGDPSRLTRGKGVHTVLFNDRFDRCIDKYSAADVPNRITAFALRKRRDKVLLDAPDPLSGIALGTTRVFSIRNDQGDDLYCRMILPVAFDSSRTYPVIVYLYNGPNIQMLSNRWLAGANLWFHYLAEKGFIVFTLEGRGSANRGLAFEQALFRRLGTVELEDQLAGVRFLKSLPYVDAGRLGIHGWSYGGFMTTGMVTRNPGIFKVAVAGGAVIDWRYYEVMYTERYMDTPQENPEGYATSNLLNYVQNLDCKLLLIHGSADDVVVLQHHMMYVKKAIEAGKQIDTFEYPGYGHNVRGKDRMHLLDMISQYFIDHL